MIILDIESTGLDPRIHSIVSIGAFEFENPTNQFYVECRPREGAELHEKAMAVNGFSEEYLFGLTKTHEEAVHEFFEWGQALEEHTLGGHNMAGLDIPMLMDAAFRYRLDWTFPKRSIDTHSLTYMHLVKRGVAPPVEKGRTAISSSYVQEYTGIPEEPKPHNALNGAKVAGEAISRLLYGKNLLPEFEGNPIPEYLL